MSWGRNRGRTTNMVTTREPQAALSGSKRHSIIQHVNQLRVKQVRLASQPFTLDELMDLFVDESHHRELRYVYDLIEPSGITNHLWVAARVPIHLAQHQTNPACMHFNWWGKQPSGFYVPNREGSEEKYAVGVLRKQADPALVERYDQVEQDLLDIHSRFDMCERVINSLNDTSVCRTLPQMRYVWPAIVILLKKAGYEDDAASVAQPSARAGDKSNVPEWLGALLKETNDTIVRATMLDDVEMPEGNLPVEYSLVDYFKTN